MPHSISSSISDSDQRAARAIGVLFLITFVTSIVGYAFYGPVLDHTSWVLGSDSDTYQATWGVDARGYFFLNCETDTSESGIFDLDGLI